MGIKNAGFCDDKRSQVDKISMEEYPGLLALEIPKAWQNTVTGGHFVKADFKRYGVKEMKTIKGH